MRFEFSTVRFQNRCMNTNNNENLFRQQAIDSLSKKQPGPPICLMPRPWAWLTGLVALLFISTAVFVASAEYSRRETVRGWVVSKEGVVRITSRASAVVNEVVRQPGDHVSKGEPLIYLSTDSVLSDGNSKNEEVLDQLRQEILEIDKQLVLSAQQQRLDGASLGLQLGDFDLEVAALLSRLEGQRSLIALSSDKLKRLESAAIEGAVKDWDVLKQREVLGELEQDLGRLVQETASRKRERELLDGNQESLPLRGETQRSILRARLTQLSQQIVEYESRRLSVLESPVTGTVSSVEVHSGYSTAPQQLLMTVLPLNTTLAAEVFVPSSAAGFIRPGQTVRIAYDAFPQQKFGTFEGRIIRISEYVLLPAEIPQTFSLREATYKLQIAINDSTIAPGIGAAGLRPGMLLAADIILEKRNLIDWLLEPLRLRRSSAG